MNDTQALFSRLTALRAYFEGGETLWQAEEVFSPRAILAQGRVSPTERIRAAEAQEAGSSSLVTLQQLLQNLPQERLQRLFEAPQGQTASGTMMPSGIAQGGFSPLSPSAAVPQMDAETLSRAFSRDARRYDE